MRRLWLNVSIVMWLCMLTIAAGLSGKGKTAALEGAVAKMKYIGLFKTLLEEALTAETASGNKLKMTGSEGKGYKNEKVVFFTEINGKTYNASEPQKNYVAGLYLNQPYFIIGAESAAFEVSETIGGAAVTLTEAVKITTKVALVEEINSGNNRKATSFTTTGPESSSTEQKISVPASTTVTFAGWWSVAKQSEETKAHEDLYSGGKLENPETFTGAGEYSFTVDKLEANPVTN